MSQPPGEPWIRAAMSDDHIVAELLLRLQGSSQHRPPSTTSLRPLKWTVRQRRSRPPPPHGDSSKKPSPRRASPTTPLSCGAGSSHEYGSEGSTRNHARVSVAAEPARSKINEDGQKTTVIKKSRKRKTLAELKEEEISLVKERRQLKREIAALRVNLEKQRAANENLKRIKNELHLLPDSKTTPCPDASSSQHSSSSAACPRKNTDCKEFVVPDLNMPFEEEANAEVLCGVS